MLAVQEIEVLQGTLEFLRSQASKAQGVRLRLTAAQQDRAQALTALEAAQQVHDDVLAALEAVRRGGCVGEASCRQQQQQEAGAHGIS